MQRERITDNILVFRSDQYAQVTAGVVLTSAGAVLIDTLLYPEESRRIRRFVEAGLGYEFAFVINTHFHADHTTGTCFFPGAQVIGHRLCRDLLDTRGRDGLQHLQESSPEFESVRLVLPNIVFDDELTLCLGDTTITMWSSPGHSPDSIVCLVEEEDILFAADTVMPIPYFVDGDFEDFKRSLRRLRNAGFENIVQGHGDIILRGEAEKKLDSDLAYLDLLDQAVAGSIGIGAAEAEERITAEDCGKSQVLLNGLVRELHRQNLRSMIERRQRSDKGAGTLL
ncbi:MAG: MBL fold metallo-hydrolase [Chloroflexota bacterium]|nr:MBL fold metallo-hydrolase [Chloroflexota bacterium]